MKATLILITALLITPLAQADNTVDGLIVKASPYSVSQTLDRLEAALKKKGITVILRWAHDRKARAVGIPLRPTELLLFGNPKLGSHFFTSRQSAGIDLPMKALAWEDADGKVWLGYNDPAYIAARHHIENRKDVIKKMQGALNKMTDIAISK
jgi:uncharacterized protein (DUF302 family)